MFDKADLIALPRLESGAGDGALRGNIPRERVHGAEEVVERGVLNRNLCHVIDACAMGGHDVALAMSNGELCHADISKGRTAAPEAAPADGEWPHWTSWPTRHGKVLSLQHDPANDALVTIEQATTAAGDQAFLGRYHRRAGLSSKERKRDGKGDEASDAKTSRTTSRRRTTSWVGSSVPLATNHAIVAVCASRGWVAVCTGSVVNLWAVARQVLGQPTPRRRGARLRQTQAPVGFEHALSVDLAELIGAKDGMGKAGGAKRIALYGNLLAVATDHTVFLVNLRFDVKGEVSPRCNSIPATGSTAPATPSSRGDAESPMAASPQSHPSRSSPRDKSATGSRDSATALKSDPKDFPPKSASRGGPSSSRGKSSGSAGADEGSTGRSPGVRKDGGREKSKMERRDGVVERAISEADDVVVCVIDAEREEDGREADGSAQPPPLLRSFDDDWEAIRSRGEYSTEQSELETVPLETNLTSSVALPVSGNSTVLDRVGGCEVVLGRRVGPGEVVKQLHLLPVSQKDDAPNSDGKPGTAPGEPRLSPRRSCRFVLLTTKAATTCFICPRPGNSNNAPAALSPFPALGRPPSPGFPERRSPTPPSPSSLSAPSPAKQRTGRLGDQSGPVGSGSRFSGGSAGSAARGHDHGHSANHDHEHEHDHDYERLDVFLRRSCRFNHDLLLASITSFRQLDID
eukprot:g16346.t1